MVPACPQKGSRLQDFASTQELASAVHDSSLPKVSMRTHMEEAWLDLEGRKTWSH